MPMAQWTEAELRQFAPRARDEYIAALIDGWHEMDRAAINTPERVCCFLSRWSQETDGFSILREDLNYKSAKRIAEVWPERFKLGAADPRAMACVNNPDRLACAVYDGRMGNGPGDGARYIGRGMNQVTGRENYRRYGQRLGIDLEEHPELAEQPSISIRIAILEWTDASCNRYADRLNLRAIGNAINRGSAFAAKEPIGFDRQKAEFDRAWAIFGADQLPPIAGIDLGDVGVEVETLQRKLTELGYPVGKPDGIYGPSLKRAVAGFKAQWALENDDELEPGDLVGARTMAAISRADPIQASEERATASVADVAATGSTTISSGKAVQKGGLGLLGLGAIDAAQSQGVGQTDVLNQLSALPAAQSALEPAIRSLSWLMANAKWAILIVIGVFLLTKGTGIIREYVARYRAGHIHWR